MNVIEFQNVTKTYDDVRALDSVSFTVDRGEVFGYIGPNGAGKTTTIKILTGLVRDYQGAVLIDGRPVEEERDSFHARVGYLPQIAGFQEWRTVRHALTTFGRLSGLERETLQNRITSVSRRMRLTDHLDRRIVHLSGGMQQRLRFAQAILHEPEIIILDEPLSGLDPASRAELKQIIRELAGMNHTIMLSSHVLSDVEDLAGRIVILDHGAIRASGTKEELRDKYRLGTLVELQGPGVNGPLAGAAQLPQVEKVVPLEGSTEGSVLHIAAGTSVDEAMRAILEFSLKESLAVRSIRHLHPSLEEVYLSLTEAN
jgi:ABC-2 type transport system ATP-binding protein